MVRSAHFAAVLLGATLLAPTAIFADTNITIAGSTALQPLAQAAADAYQQAHPDVKISVTGGGSGQGIAQAASKGVDIGDSDILAPTHPELTDNKVAVVGFSVIVNPASGVTGLTKEQIQSIFSGKVTNWKDVGGKDEPITVINRPAGSGTRAVFLKTLMGSATLAQDSLVEDATGTVVQKVIQTAGAVSYASFSGTHNKTGLTEVSINGAQPNDADVIAGKYPFWSYEHMFTNGPATGEVAKFIDFTKSNGALFKKLNFILISDMKVSETNR
jgi:phosphate transport system substrate-binding protein